jgi:hypothetical protein
MELHTLRVLEIRLMVVVLQLARKAKEKILALETGPVLVAEKELAGLEGLEKKEPEQEGRKSERFGLEGAAGLEELELVGPELEEPELEELAQVELALGEAELK